MPCIHWGQLRRCDFATCGIGASQNSAAPTNVIISDRVWWIWCDAGLATVATRP